MDGAVFRGGIAMHISGKTIIASTICAAAMLAGCGVAAGENSKVAKEETRAEVTPADRTAIMRAAGFTRRGNEWTTCEGEEKGNIKEFHDLNGDGSPEALITSFGNACHGFVGSGFTLLTRQSGNWRVLVQNSGIPKFFSREGMAWPDLEIGGPGTDCFGFLRWDGQAYVPGGTSVGGEICTLRPQFAAGSPPPDSRLAGTDEGILGQIPVRLGYYVSRGESCASPSYLYKFERTRHLEIADNKGRAEVLRYDYASVSGEDDGFYFITLADAGPEDPEEIGIKPFRGGIIELLIQDIVELSHCPESQVPAKLRR